MKEKNFKTEQPNPVPDLVDASTAVRLDPVLSPLHPRQRAFVLAYLKCGIGAQAARDAGYAKAGARNRATLLMKVPSVRSAIAECRRIITERTGYDVVMAMAEFDAVITFAKATKNANAMCRAVELRAKMAGLLDAPSDGEGSALSIHIDLGGSDDAPRTTRTETVIEAEVIPPSLPQPSRMPMETRESPAPGAFYFNHQFPELNQRGPHHEPD